MSVVAAHHGQSGRPKGIWLRRAASRSALTQHSWLQRGDDEAAYPRQRSQDPSERFAFESRM